MKQYFLSIILIINFTYANSCLECHKGIEDIREPHTKMAKEIAKKAKEAGVKGNSCIVCHGGNPKAFKKSEAHSGTIVYFKTHSGPKEFYPDPGSPWINRLLSKLYNTNQQSHSTSSLDKNFLELALASPAKIFI